MQTEKKIYISLISVLITILSFFLHAFYNKVDTIATTLEKIEVAVAVSNSKLENLERRVSNLEIPKNK